MNGTNQTQLRQDIERLRGQASRLEQDAQALDRQGKTQDAQDLRKQAQASIEQASRLEQDYNQGLELNQLFKRQADRAFGNRPKQ
jgi:hypothetical protein